MYCEVPVPMKCQSPFLSLLNIIVIAVKIVLEALECRYRQNHEIGIIQELLTDAYLEKFRYQVRTVISRKYSKQFGIELIFFFLRVCG